MVKHKNIVSKSINQDKATASLLFGIMSFVTFILWFLGILFGVLGVLFGISAIRSGQDKGRAIAGIVMGASGIVAALGVTLLIMIATPPVHENQRDVDRTSEANNLALQISNLVSDENKSKISASDLSTDGFSLIKYVKESGEPTQTLAIFESGKFCDGTVGPNDYSIVVLMDDSSPYCTGFKQN